MPASSKSKAVVSTKRGAGPGSDEDFVFESSVGTITVPSMAKAPKPNAWEMLEIEAIENPRVAKAKSMLMMLRISAADAIDLVKQLDVEEMNEFMMGWTEHSGVDAGES
jgi:hypothetical protein